MIPVGKKEGNGLKIPIAGIERMVLEKIKTD
jgi:hypothetical protein